MARIACFEVEDWEIPVLKSAFRNHTFSFVKKPLTLRRLKDAKDAKVLVVFIHSKVTEEIIDKLPQLKCVVTMSTGYDHIDVQACRRRGIKVANVPTYGANTVAEHTMALLLAISRKLPQSLERAKKRFSPKGLRGFDLKEKTLGIMGMGNIGSHVARMAKAFDMRVLAFNRSKDPELAKEVGFRYVSLDTLLKQSDVISLHLPLTKQTKYILDHKEFQKMKKGVVLLNTARGALIRTRAFVKALDKNIVSCAGLDVLEEECYITEERELLSSHLRKECNLQTVVANHWLIQRDDVLVTPHNAFNSQESIERILHTTIKNIKGFFKGRMPNRVHA